jgi:hypothetical protein
MATLQQQKDAIDYEAQKLKDEADRLAVEARQTAADEESEIVRDEAEKKVQEIQNNAQN